VNSTHFTGAASNVEAGKTPDGAHRFLNFVLTDDSDRQPVSVRVTAYDELADGFVDQVSDGRRIAASGRLRSKVSRGARPLIVTWIVADSLAIGPVR
jgi:hypothetical protein